MDPGKMSGRPNSRCTVCDRPPIGAAVRSLRGELTCAAHPTVNSCAFCGRPAVRRTDHGWRDLGGEIVRCPSCAVDAVETAEHVRGSLRDIRQTLADLGFSLRTRVRVVPSTVDELHGGAPLGGSGIHLGTTEMIRTDARSAQVTVIRVLAGLPATVFGQVVAHELGHAWLAQFGARPGDIAVEEGVCELISYAWLKRANTPYAHGLREQIRLNPDPVYGAGFRLVHAATHRHGLKTIITSLATSGRLPR
jgi:Protein DA1